MRNKYGPYCPCVCITCLYFIILSVSPNSFLKGHQRLLGLAQSGIALPVKPVHVKALDDDNENFLLNLRR